LEFYSKKRKNWTFNDDVLKWEIWTIRIGCMGMGMNRTRLGEVLMDKVLNIIQVVNSDSYLPAMPSERFLSTVFDTSFQDVQPYLHKVCTLIMIMWNMIIYLPILILLSLRHRSDTGSKIRFILTSVPSQVSDPLSHQH
jgi:hypothetical protein